MRLSNTQKLLIHLLLINFLTLFSRHDAKAQIPLFANNFTYKDHRKNRFLLVNAKDTPNFNIVDTVNSDAGFTTIQASAITSFRHSSETFQMPAHRIVIDNVKGCTRHSIIPCLYSIDLRHGARLTFKIFKLVISPLW